ncbi:MAG: glycerophosphodiester phosphodiesterase family protein [Candidatus Nanoarchaeia archaeon]|nr:glycerophosphodiester phosphodiesterase family protein [Candidatus Nanoarchaeia archaeon]
MEEKIMLHRGYKGKYPENSRKAFENALKENRSFETDIRVSKDGVCFMIHDDNIDRLMNGSGKISDMTSEELKRFHYKEDETQGLCSLKEVCELAGKFKHNNLIFIHIKELKDVERVIDVLRRYNLHENIRFFAVDEIEKEFKKMMRASFPEYQIGLYFSDGSEINEKEFENADFIWADEKTDKENITEELVNFAHSKGKPVYAISPELIPESSFNANIEKRWLEFLEAGVDMICTDSPQKFQEFLMKVDI